MIHELVHNALNKQINAELAAWYGYLGMAAWCSGKQLHGCAKWLKSQAQEEHSHAMKLYEFLVARNLTIQMLPLDEPRTEFESVVDIFQEALKSEEENTRRIHKIFELALEQKAFASLVELQWFITEQVEEEAAARDNLAKAELVADDLAAMLDLDEILGNRELKLQAAS
ncbi:MAG: ferritin [Planctomycetaceae bacterium]|jgi:ferritin